MKKFFLSLVAAVAVVASVSAQETGFGWGVKAGVNIANISNVDASSKVGFTGGLFADYRFSQLFAVSADLLYSGQGCKDDGIKLNNSYLNVPILANFYLVKGLAVKAGLQPGFLLSAKAKGGGKTEDIKDNYKGFDLAIPVGLSYDFNCGLVLDARYNIGMSKVGKDSDVKARNNVISITAGWRF